MKKAKKEKTYEYTVVHSYPTTDGLQRIVLYRKGRGYTSFDFLKKIFDRNFPEGICEGQKAMVTKTDNGQAEVEIERKLIFSYR